MITFVIDEQSLPLGEQEVELAIQTKKDWSRICLWLRAVAADYDFTVGDLHYIFCNNERELEINQQFLQHDYYTDIITFDYTSGNQIEGDIFLSLEMVRENAETVQVPAYQELMRILAHGLLHLTGQGDKTPETKAVMTEKENLALSNPFCPTQLPTQL